MQIMEPLSQKICAEDRGFSLLDIMISMGLGTIAIVTTIAVITQAAQVRRIENLRTSAVAVREQIMKNMARYDNFQETIHNNAQFLCLKPAGGRNCGVTNMVGWEAGDIATSVGGVAGPQFNLMVATGGGYSPSFNSTMFYNAANTNAGFTDDGIVCTGPSAAPNKTCPIRVDLYWWSLCSGVCNPGMIGIKVVIRTYNDENKKTVTTPYGFQMIKSVYDDGTRGPFPYTI